VIEPLEQIKARAESAAIEGLTVDGNALIVDRAWLLPMARFLRDDPALRLDFLASLCAVDWLAPKDHLEVVYHLYSVSLRHGPLTLKCRTANRSDETRVPSVTPIWRGAEFQEREAFDLYGVIFDGHPDLRRILMWDEFTDFPMRKDYVPPDDYEWEPTPHGPVIERVKARDSP
jgi:NADH-quinone oxidoreductase subunit C